MNTDKTAQTVLTLSLIHEHKLQKYDPITVGRSYDRAGVLTHHGIF